MNLVKVLKGAQISFCTSEKIPPKSVSTWGQQWQADPWCVLISGPLHFLCPLPGRIFLRMWARLQPSCLPVLYEDVFSSGSSTSSLLHWLCICFTTVISPDINQCICLTPHTAGSFSASCVPRTLKKGSMNTRRVVFLSFSFFFFF